MRVKGKTALAIATSIERAIADGALGPNEAVPSVRGLSEQLGVSASTVAAAYRDLRSRGLLTSRPGGRTRVSALPPLVLGTEDPVPQGVRDVASGNPDPRLLPPLRPAFAGIDWDTPHLYGGPLGYGPLLELAANDFNADGVETAGVTVVGGAMDGLERVLVAHARVGDRVIVEDPCYTGVLRLVRALGLEPVPAAIDDRGITPDNMADGLAAGARVCILTPRAQNPLGAAFDRERATELRAVLAAYPGVLVVENDHAGVVAGTPYHTLTEGRERWAVIRSVSKTLGPDLRVGVLAADEVTVRRVEGRQVVGCGWVSHLLQRAVAGLWSDAVVQASLRQTAASYAERRDDLVAALADRGVSSSARSGLNVYVPVAEEVQAMRALLTRGWLLRAGEPYRIHSQPFVRATIALVDRNEIKQLADAVAEALAPHRGTRVA